MSNTHTHNSQFDPLTSIFGEKAEIICSLMAGALLTIGYLIETFFELPKIISLTCYLFSYFLGGYYTMREAIHALSHGKFEIDFLMIVAAIGAGILGAWSEGALLLFLFSMGHALEHRALDKAKKSIEALAGLAAKTALLKVGSEIKEVSVQTLIPGNVILVKPNTKIAADGYVLSGSSTVNQAPITGESMPVDKTAVPDAQVELSKVTNLDAKYRVFAGTINGNSSLEVVVTKLSADSTLSRLIKMVNEAQQQKSDTQILTDKVETYYVPALLFLVVSLCLAFLVIDETFAASFYRAISVLVAASPCALAIATPSAVLSGIARAARDGVLIKGGRPLEELGRLTALALDKTGTLTEGKPKLTDIIPFNNTSEAELLKIVIAVESLSNHPLAKAIVSAGKVKLGNLEIPMATESQEINGKGLFAHVEKQEVYIGNLELFTSGNLPQPSSEILIQMQTLQKSGRTSMLVMFAGNYIGLLGMMDVPRAEAKEVITQLKTLGIKKIIMLTGDHQEVAEAIAKSVGITDVYGSLLPEEKVIAVKKLRETEKQLAMVGDGVNDAPAMANSTVGISMGAASSDVALETADIALLGDNLKLLPFAIGLSRKAHQIIRQNLVISLGMVAILLPLTIFDIATIGPAVIAHEGSTIIVVLNALRLLGYQKQ